MGRPGEAPITTAERLARVAQDTAGITRKPPGKVAVAGKTALAVGKIAGPAYGAVKGAEFLAHHSAMKGIEEGEAKRKEQP